MDILLGADPEMFVYNTKKEEYVSANGLIPGTKEHPWQVNDGAVQVDGMAAEFNIEPASSEDEWVDNIKSVMRQLQDMLPPDHELRAIPCVTFSEDEWNRVPDEAKILGCDPDLNAYTGLENAPPNPEVDFRTAAGHIHIGWRKGGAVDSQGHRDACRILAKELDYYLSYPFSMVDTSKEGVKRRELYGNLGAYRIKPYGMEYRVLSNLWLSDEKYMRWVYRQVQKCVHNLKDGKYFNQTTKKSANFDLRLSSYTRFSVTVDGINTLKARGLILPIEAGEYLKAQEEHEMGVSPTHYIQPKEARNPMNIGGEAYEAV